MGGELLLPPKGGYFLSACKNSSILLGQCDFAFSRTGLSNGNNHRILTPTISGVYLGNFTLASLTLGFAIELQNLFTTDRPDYIIGQTRLVNNCNSEKVIQDTATKLIQDFRFHFLFLVID
jgi:hypothetical protein